MQTFFLNIDDITDKDIALIKRCFPKRFENAQKFAQYDDFLRNIGAALLLYRHLRIAEKDLLFTTQRKPYLKGGPFFNYSHSNKMIVLVISDTDVGIDVEYLDEKNLRYAKRIFTSNEEITYIEKCPIKNFHLLWTRLEATKKCLGNISITKKLNVLLTANTIEINEKRIELQSQIRDQYAITVAILKH